MLLYHKHKMQSHKPDGVINNLCPFVKKSEFVVESLVNASYCEDMIDTACGDWVLQDVMKLYVTIL